MALAWRATDLGVDEAKAAIVEAVDAVRAQLGM